VGLEWRRFKLGSGLNVQVDHFPHVKVFDVGLEWRGFKFGVWPECASGSFARERMCNFGLDALVQFWPECASEILP